MPDEFIPIDAYRLLRRLHVNRMVRTPGGNPDDDAAVGFLLTRGLAKKSDDGDHLTITDAGKAVGRITTKSPHD